MNIDIKNNEVVLNYGDLLITEKGDYLLIVCDGVTNNVVFLDVKSNTMAYTYKPLEALVERVSKMEDVLATRFSRVKEVISGSHLSLTLKR